MKKKPSPRKPGRTATRRKSTAAPPIITPPVRLAIDDVVDWPLKLMQLLDALRVYMWGGAFKFQQMCSALRKFGQANAGDLNAAAWETLWRLYVSRAHETAPDTVANEYNAQMPAELDAATVFMRVLDVFAHYRRDRLVPTSVWPDYGIASDERDLILRLYLLRAGHWSTAVCDSRYAEQVLLDNADIDE